jgi:hypothetical protein
MRNPTVLSPIGAVDARTRFVPVVGAVLLVSLVAWVGGCNKKNDGPRPASIAPNPAAASGAPSTAPAIAPAIAPASGTGGASGGTGTISGKITLASARKGDVTPADIVYLVARRVPDNPAARGSLVAVKRYTAASFPIEFTLGAGDMMFKNGAFEGELTLSVRVDKDGDPMTRRKGDVFGTIDRVKVGASRVELKLDQLQKEDESLAGAPPAPGGMPAGHP